MNLIITHFLQFRDTGGYENAIELVGDWRHRIGLFSEGESSDSFNSYEYLAGEPGNVGLHKQETGLSSSINEEGLWRGR